MMEVVFIVDVVVVNLIYYVVVLKYDGGRMGVFIVVVLGVDEIVLCICEVVDGNKVVIVFVLFLVCVLYWEG